MGYWKCKRCGNEIVMVIPIRENFSFLMNKNGEPYMRYSNTRTIDEYIKQDYERQDFLYHCHFCDEENKILENIAYWED